MWVGKLYNTGMASITPAGIVFNNRIYTCRRAIKEQWFSHSFQGDKNLTILYQPEDTSSIIIGNSESGELCRMVIITPYEGKRLTDYYEAIECFKNVKRKYTKTVTSKNFIGDSGDEGIY